MSLLPHAGEVTRGCPFSATREKVTRECPFSPTREKVAEGRMRGHRALRHRPAAQPLNPHPPGSRPRDPSDLSRPRER